MRFLTCLLLMSCSSILHASDLTMTGTVSKYAYAEDHLMFQLIDMSDADSVCKSNFYVSSEDPELAQKIVSAADQTVNLKYRQVDKSNRTLCYVVELL